MPDGCDTDTYRTGSGGRAGSPSTEDSSTVVARGALPPGRAHRETRADVLAVVQQAAVFAAAAAAATHAHSGRGQ